MPAKRPILPNCRPTHLLAALKGSNRDAYVLITSSAPDRVTGLGFARRRFAELAKGSPQVDVVGHECLPHGLTASCAAARGAGRPSPAAGRAAEAPVNGKLRISAGDWSSGPWHRGETSWQAKVTGITRNARSAAKY